MKKLIVLAAILPLACGCGVAAKVEARNNMQQSLAAYKHVLLRTPRTQRLVKLRVSPMTPTCEHIEQRRQEYDRGIRQTLT